jgi:hypothetical protein
MIDRRNNKNLWLHLSVITETTQSATAFGACNGAM